MFVKLFSNLPVISNTGTRLSFAAKQVAPNSFLSRFHTQHHQQQHNETTNTATILRQPPKLQLQLPTIHSLRSFRSSSEADGKRAVMTSTEQDTDDDRIVPVSLAHIRKTVRSSGADLQDGYCCLRTGCPVCVEPATASKTPHKDRQQPPRDVYINKTTGTLVCPQCQITRSWSTMEPFFQRPATSSATSKAAGRDSEAARQAFIKSKELRHECWPPDATAVPIGAISAAAAAQVLQHLGLDMFELQLLDSLGALCSVQARRVLFPLHDGNGETVGYKVLERSADTDEGDGELVERTVPEANCFGVLAVAAGAATASPAKSQRDSANAVVVLNVVDLLALAVQKLTTPIVCLPHGFASLPQHVLPALERYSRLTLWFHNDAVSWDCARTFAKKLDERRCVFVRPTEAHPAPFAALMLGNTAAQPIDARQVLASAQPVLHKAITTFAALRQDVLSDIQNVDKVQGVKWRRFPVLNKLLKGHRKGELTVLTGPTGCGKTTFMSEYSLDLTQQGVTTLWGSFEIRNTRLASTLLRQLAGHPFDERLEEFDRWANEFERLPMYFMTFHGQQSIKVVMETIEHAQYVHDIQHVIIDNVQFMMGTADEPKHVDRFWRQDAIIGAFRTFATKKNCHVTLVIHPRKERDVDDLTTSSIFGGAKATQEADNVLIIQDKRLTAIRGKKYLQVAKNRYSGDLGIMPMDFDKEALSYATKKPAATAVKKTSENVPESRPSINFESDE